MCAGRLARGGGASDRGLPEQGTPFLAYQPLVGTELLFGIAVDEPAELGAILFVGEPLDGAAFESFLSLAAEPFGVAAPTHTGTFAIAGVRRMGDVPFAAVPAAGFGTKRKHGTEAEPLSIASYANSEPNANVGFW